MSEEKLPLIDIGNFPSIEIDTEHWKTLAPRDRFRYLYRLVFQEKDLGNRLNMLNFIAKTTVKIGKVFIKNKEIKEYLGLFEYSGELVATTVAIGNLFKAKQTFRNTKNNEIAKLMGFPNGNHVSELNLDVTNAMVEAFLDMNDHHKIRYNIEIENIISDDDKKEQKGSDEDTIISKKVKIIGVYGKDEDATKNVKFGMIFHLTGAIFEGEATTAVSKGKLFHPATGMKMHSDAFKDAIQQIFYEMYVEKIDTSKNILRINGTKLEVSPRLNIRENIVNIDIGRISTAVEKTLREKRRRGVVLVGEPGTGKTIAVHKTINGFRNKLVFWVSPDSVNTVTGIRNVRKIIKMFEGCIVVFDDLDSAPLTSKNEITNEFLSMLDGTNKMSCFIFATVNDPSKIHMSLINRPERLDDIFLVKKPQTVAEVSDIIITKCQESGYNFKSGGSLNVPLKGIMSFNKTSVEFKKACQQAIDKGFTQVQVSGIVSDCDAYNVTGTITIKMILDAIHSRVESITCANMKAVKGRLEVDMDGVSEEASAMYKHG